MKHLITALAYCSVLAALTTPASADDAAMNKARIELRNGCAQSHASFIANHLAGNAPEYRGEKFPGDNKVYSDAKPCTEEQLAAYLDRADPVTVMQAYPSAAGRPKAKKPVTAASKPGES